MRECLSIHMGQAGVRTGAALWELFRLEHGIKNDGTLDPEFSFHGESRESFFRETRDGKFVPRALFFDTDPTLINAVKKSGDMFDQNLFLSSNKDSANNFALGRLAETEELADRIRLMIEACSSMQGHLLFHSNGGGTGSGTTVRMLDALAMESTKTKYDFSIQPGPQYSQSNTEPYNAILAAPRVLDRTDISFLFENKALYEICQTRLGIERPRLEDMNTLITHSVSAITSQLRFSKELNVNMTELVTNLVPTTRQNTPIVSLAPILPPERALHQHTVDDITNQCLESPNQLLGCNRQNGKYMACAMIYRGSQPGSILNQAVSRLGGKVKFIDFHPGGIKNISVQCPVAMPPTSKLAKVNDSATMLSNHTAVGEYWSRLGKQFDLMYAERAYVHLYLENGLMEQDFTDAREEVSMLERDYYMS